MAGNGSRRGRILVVDDDRLIGELVAGILSPHGFQVESAGTGEAALALMRERPPFDILLTDLHMPGMNGLALLETVRRLHPTVGVIVVTAKDDAVTAVEAIRLGAFDYLTKPLSQDDLPDILAKAMEKRHLLEVAAGHGGPFEEGTPVDGVASLVDVLEAKDTYSEGHCKRVGMYSRWLVDEIGLASAVGAGIVRAARVHDLGKLLIGGPWLNSAAPLTPRDIEVLREHSRRGVEALREVLSPVELTYVASHHERWDGQGYPKGISGHRIPLGARVIGIADAYDAMTSRRSFRESRLRVEALAEIEACAGTQFDPHLVPPFLAVVRRRLGE